MCVSSLNYVGEVGNRFLVFGRWGYFTGYAWEGDKEGKERGHFPLLLFPMRFLRM